MRIRTSCVFAPAPSTQQPDQILGRYSYRVGAGQRTSFATYFNAFPASYWRRWTIVDDVNLTVEVQGRGATVIVYKSMAKGHSQRVAAESTTDGETTRFSFPLSLKPFIDGGWYWYDVVAGDDLRHTQLFLAARGEQYLPALFFFAVLPFVDARGMASAHFWALG